MNPVDYEVYGKTFAAGAAVKLGGTAIDFVVLVKAKGPTGLRARAGAIPPASRYCFLSAAKRIPIPMVAGSVAREITIHDLSGKCLRKTTLRTSETSFDAGDAVGEGVHIIRVKAL